ncbi:MAG: fluoride efflux transporter CrcB [Bacteroidota bacterium]
MVRNYLYVFFGGGLGSSLRYWLSGVIPRYTGSQFPYGILIVNIIGCFFIGFLMSALEERFLMNSSLRVLLTIGIIGGFTTFSTFSYETLAMMRDSEFLKASLYVGLSLTLGLGGTYLGSLMGKLI